MHAGEAKNSKGQRAHGGIFYAPVGEMITPTGIRDAKCTPVRRETAATAGTRWHILSPKRLNEHAGGDSR